MKIKSLLIAASLALVPATAAMADDAKKEALKKAKEKAKEAAKEAAKEKAAEKSADNKAKVAAKAADAKAAAEEAAKAEAEMHSKHTGAIERLEQIAGATNDEALKTVVARLKEKEAKRHGMVAPAK